MVTLIGRKIPTTGVQGYQAGGLGDVFDRIASTLADPLTPAIKREKLTEMNRQNVSTEAAMQAARQGLLADRNTIASWIGSGMPAQNLGVFNLFDVASRRGAEAPETSTAAVAAGHPIQQTALGMQKELENRLAQINAQEAMKRTLANDVLTPVFGPGGVPVYGRTGEAVGQVIPPKPSDIKNVSFWDPNTRNIYQSQDGGATVLVGTSRVPVSSMNLQPISNEQAVAQQQDTLTRQSLGALPPVPTTPSRAALAAETTSGLKAPLKHDINVLAGVLGAGEAFPQTNEARNYLTNLVASTRNTLMSAPGRVSVQAQKWAAEPFPQPGWFGMTGINAEEQKNNVYRTISHLRDVYEAVRQEAQDINLPPAERQRYAAYLHSLKNTIQMWEAPAPETATATPAAPTPAAVGGAQAAPAQMPIRVKTPEEAAKLPPGTRYVTPDGQQFDR